MVRVAADGGLRDVYSWSLNCYAPEPTSGVALQRESRVWVVATGEGIRPTSVTRYAPRVYSLRSGGGSGKGGVCPDVASILVTALGLWRPLLIPYHTGGTVEMSIGAGAGWQIIREPDEPEACATGEFDPPLTLPARHRRGPDAFAPSPPVATGGLRPPPTSPCQHPLAHLRWHREPHFLAKESIPS